MFQKINLGFFLIECVDEGLGERERQEIISRQVEVQVEII
jgi:hypothetical protein